MWRMCDGLAGVGAPAAGPVAVRCPVEAGRCRRHGQEDRGHRGTHLAGPTPKVAGHGPEVTIAGEPGEHVLFGAGRQGVARVELTGDDHLVERLRSASLGI